MTFQGNWIIISTTLQDTWNYDGDSKKTKVYLAGIMVSEVMSNKSDGKEQNLKQERITEQKNSGRYLYNSRNEKVRHRKLGKYLSVILLLAWDGLLLYMMVECLIEPVYGAAFVAVVSVYLGNKL